MATIVTTDIFCDLCEEYADDAAAVGNAARMKDTRNRAAWIGWRLMRVNNKLFDVCPECVAKYNDEDLRDKLRYL